MTPVTTNVYIGTGTFTPDIRTWLVVYVFAHAGAAGDEATCPICLEEFVDGDRLSQFRCRHPMHLQCAKAWFCQCLSQHKNATCPLCIAVLCAPVAHPDVAHAAPVGFFSRRMRTLRAWTG